MAETVIVHGEAGGVDDRGFPIPGKPDVQVAAKSVQPLSQEEISDMGRDGVKDALRVWVPSGTAIAPGDEVTVRGLRYSVVKNGWDWGSSRRPRLTSHRPSFVFECVRGAG